MKSILEELYDGNIYPDELIISKDHEYRPLNKRISEMLTMIPINKVHKNLLLGIHYY
ncbi:DUF6809 family protein [Ruminiclostridium cellobioparum]|uniref:DUF6809 family protein n=1 Tax=Ruminiclostridium cellobioparum TaxID=29355 RepID=UPI0013F3E613|nr:DUF6809 family protein [Ruminiclostridium cellobioparum]